MPAQWTAEVIGEMHLKGIQRKQLAAHLGVTPEYVSKVLHGERNPKDGEDRFRMALREIEASNGSADTNAKNF